MPHVVRYRVPEEHHAVTVRDGEEFLGSIHHPEHAEFTGLVTHSHDDGTHDIVIFPPRRPPVHVEHVPEGDGPGSLTLNPAAGHKRPPKDKGAD